MKVEIILDNLEMIRVINDGSLMRLMESIEDENKFEGNFSNDIAKPKSMSFIENQPQAQQEILQSTVTQSIPKTVVPTTVKTYSIDELGRAAMGLMDMGKQQDLVNLLSNFGVPALPQLPKEQYSEFAVKLRELGADI
ncbi:MAG: hypothetical protein Q4E50_06985 [Tissierellia bacterium]|nr:hypothetical protein [Tissierellia bacterium]